MDNLDEAMSKIFGSSSSNSKMAKYSVDQIEAAKKRQKKCGGTLMDNLMEVSGEKPMSVSASIDDINNMLARNSEDINATIREMNANLARDYGVSADVASSIGAAVSKDFEINPQMLKGAGTGATASKKADEFMVTNEDALANFAGISDELKSKIFGQDEFIKKLVIAFKRPYVTERDGNDALNSIFITGPECSGKHFALNCIVEELGKRRVIREGNICTMDLSLYPSAAEEQLFLQDLYSALQSKSPVILFENFESCHVSLLIRLSDLVTDGECRLSDRYVMQKGQLVSVSTSFAGETVGSFEAKGKYLIFVSSKPLDKLADVMGAPFINALGDICETKKLDEEAMKQVAEKKEETLLEKCRKTLNYTVTVDESFRDYLLGQSSRNRGLQGILDAYDDTLKALAEMKLYPDLTPKEREDEICRKYGAVFIIGIGSKLSNGEKHDGRAPDYDDWSTLNSDGYVGLNGDILIWYPVLNRSVELSSMGIRVDKESLIRQLSMENQMERSNLYFHKRLLADELPLCIGGGIGQSRLCMILLHKGHVGEIQASIWPEDMRQECLKHGMPLI